MTKSIRTVVYLRLCGLFALASAVERRQKAWLVSRTALHRSDHLIQQPSPPLRTTPVAYCTDFSPPLLWCLPNLELTRQPIVFQLTFHLICTKSTNSSECHGERAWPLTSVIRAEVSDLCKSRLCWELSSN